MSAKATNFVRRLRGLTPTEKLVCLVIADHDSHRGEGSWPSMKTVADESCLKHRETASRVTKRLADAGVVFTEQVSRGGQGQGKTTVYRFNYDLENCDSRITLFNPSSVTLESHLEPESVTLMNKKCDSEPPNSARSVTLNAASVTLQSHEGLKEKEREGKEEKGESPSFLSRFDFNSDFDIPTEAFLKIWPCPETQDQAYGWMDHVRLRLGDALASRNHWAERKSELLKNPETFTEFTLPELDERIVWTTEQISDCEQLVKDAVRAFEAHGFSMDQYHGVSTLRLHATRQVFDSQHAY